MEAERAADPSKPAGRRPRVSLLSLLLVVTLAATTTALAVAWGELRKLRADNRRLRDEVGELTVTDVEAAQAIRVSGLMDASRVYRVRLPESPAYKFCYRVHRVPGNGTPDTANAYRVPPGLYRVVVSLTERPPGTPPPFNAKVELRPLEGQPVSSSGATFNLDTDRNPDWFDSETGQMRFGIAGVADHGQEFAPGEPVVLLRARAVERVNLNANKPGAAPRWATTIVDGERDGLMVWFEPDE